jgi:hypothetical protein
MAILNLPVDKLENGPIKDCFKLIKDWSDGEQLSLLSSVGLKVQIIDGIAPPSIHTTSVVAKGKIAAVFGRAEANTVAPIRYEVMTDSSFVSFNYAENESWVGVRNSQNRPLRYKLVILYRG